MRRLLDVVAIVAVLAVAVAFTDQLVLTVADCVGAC